MNGPARVGIVPYLNAKPMIDGLDRHNEIIRPVYDVPSRLASMLKAKELDIAIIPSIEYLRSTGLHLLPGIGICSDGIVRSVKLFSRKYPENISRVALDPSSCTSNVLLRIILSEKYGCNPQYLLAPRETSLADLPDIDAILLIGDQALRENRAFTWTLDLGLEWYNLTKLPMVYAVWAGYPHFPNRKKVIPILKECLQNGLERIDYICRQEARRLDFSYKMVCEYLTQNIYYKLGENELLGLDRFRSYARSYTLIDGETTPRYKP